MNLRIVCLPLGLAALLKLSIVSTLGASSPTTNAATAATDLAWCHGVRDCLTWSPSPDAVSYNLYRGNSFEASQAPPTDVVTVEACTIGMYTTTSSGTFADSDPGVTELQWYLIGALDSGGQVHTGEATGGPRVVNAAHDCAVPAGLILNEVDYDQTGSDGAEFVEIFNPGAADVDLADIVLILVNGSTQAEYRRIALSDAGTTLPGGGFLVVGSSAVQALLPPRTPFAAFPAASNNVQNGAPDGIALFDLASGTLLDGLSYEGVIEAAVFDGVAGSFDLVPGDPTATVDSNSTDGALGRFPDGRNTGDAAADWFFIGVLSPGTANPVP